jgi:cytochrome c-type biogenesis protein CcmH
MLLTAAAFAVMAGPALAVTPDEQLPNAAHEARAQALSRELRCVVCQNQSIDDSNAPLAHDLRVILRERIAAGDSDKQAVAYLVARYGDFVRLNPPLRGDTLALWFGPLAVLLAGGAGVVLYLRGRASGAATPLEAGDEAEVVRLLKETD